jgi:ABC-type sugar transport system substrate-binding protein
LGVEFQNAIDSKVDGIAVSLPDPTPWLRQGVGKVR